MCSKPTWQTETRYRYVSTWFVAFALTCGNNDPRCWVLGGNGSRKVRILWGLELKVEWTEGLEKTGFRIKEKRNVISTRLIGQISFVKLINITLKSKLIWGAAPHCFRGRHYVTNSDWKTLNVSLIISLVETDLFISTKYLHSTPLNLPLFSHYIQSVNITILLLYIIYFTLFLILLREVIRIHCK